MDATEGALAREAKAFPASASYFFSLIAVASACHAANNLALRLNSNQAAKAAFWVFAALLSLTLVRGISRSFLQREEIRRTMNDTGVLAAMLVGMAGITMGAHDFARGPFPFDGAVIPLLVAFLISALRFRFAGMKITTALTSAFEQVAIIVIILATNNIYLSAVAALAAGVAVLIARRRHPKPA